MNTGDPSLPRATHLFIGSAAATQDGRVSYYINANNQRVYMPNICRCWIIGAEIKTVESTSGMFPPTDKLLLRVQTPAGKHYIYRTSLSTWTASTLLRGLGKLSPLQLAEQVQLTLTPKNRTTYVSVAAADADGIFHTVPTETADTRKLDYDEQLDAITWINCLGQHGSNPDNLPPNSELIPPEVYAPQEELPLEDLPLTELQPLPPQIVRPARHITKKFPGKSPIPTARKGGHDPFERDPLSTGLSSHIATGSIGSKGGHEDLAY